MTMDDSDHSITLVEDDDAYDGVKPGITLLEPSDTIDGAAAPYVFEDHYALEDRIAEGSFGQVFVARHIASDRVYAVKIILRERLNDREKDLVAREVTILKDCRDLTNIVRLVDYYSSPEKLYLVQLYAEGGDVFSRLATRTYFNEKDARDLAYQLLIAIRALHERRVAHRDLKPENILLRSLLRDSEILVADFGFATYVPEGGLKTRCGTPAFVAPEVLETNCRYDERCDMWSVGCLLYILIGGYPPFQARNHRLLFRKIRGADFCFHDQYFKHVSVAAKQLIASMLTVDPKHRVTADDAVEKSRWLKMRAADLEKADLSASLGEMKKFQARSSLKGAMRTVLWSVQCKFKSVDDVGFGDQIKEWNKTDEARDRFERSYKTEARPTLKFSDVYELGKLLHRGRTEVYECRHKHEDAVYAVKMINAKKPNRELAGKRSLSESIHHELAVLNSLDHRLILKIVDFFEEDQYFYFVTELMEGGDWFDRILANQVYTEKDARDLARTLVEAVDYLHDKKITHRDIKPQNILMKSKDNNSDIKICDFAFACRIHTPQSLTTRCGTPTYVAPEILKNIPYDERADMWSVGVVLFVILSGHPPFADDVQTALFEKIRIGDYDMDTPEWKDISDDAKNLVRNLLQINPQQRWTAKQALHCKWLVDDDPRLENIFLTETYNLIRNRKSRLKNVAKTIMWMNRHSIRKIAVSAAATAELLAAASADSAGEDEGKVSTKKSSSDDESTQNSTENEYSEKSIAELMVGATEEAVMI